MRLGFVEGFSFEFSNDVHVVAHKILHNLLDLLQAAKSLKPGLGH